LSAVVAGADATELLAKSFSHACGGYSLGGTMSDSFKVIDLNKLRASLLRQGHEIVSDDWVVDFTVRPNLDIVVIIVDPSDFPLAKRRFACAPEAEKVFSVAHCPEPHRTRWLELVKRQPEDDLHDFLAGPGSWTLSRLVRFREIVFWADRGLGTHGIENAMHVGDGIHFSQAAAPFFPKDDGPESKQPRVIHTKNENLPDVVAACFQIAFDGNRDCYIADEAGTEVYYISNDEMVFASIPNQKTRERLFSELAEAQWPFSYISSC
jgi:hypothetical protein